MYIVQNKLSERSVSRSQNSLLEASVKFESMW